MSRQAHETRSEQETEALAASLAHALRPPLVFLLEGELGAGKTTFVRGFVRALPGGEGVVVQSPTFALARSYATQPPVHHLDLYRLGSTQGLEELGLLELLEGEGTFAFVEWPGSLALQVPCARVRLAGVPGAPERRRIEIELPDASDA